MISYVLRCYQKQTKQPPTKAERQGVIMKATKKGAMEYAKEKWIDTDRERIVDTFWKDEVLRVTTITKVAHLVYRLVIAYDDIYEEYYKIDSCSGYMFNIR